MLKLLRMGYFYTAVVLTAIVALPVFFARPFNPKNTSFFFNIFGRATFWPMGVKYEESGRQNFENNIPSILVGNHQHNLDIMMASKALSTRVVALGKKELLRIPFLGLCFYLGGNVVVDRGNRERAIRSLKKVRGQLAKNNVSVVIFPEGTRNEGKDLLPFKRGAFITAIQTQLPIVPFAVARYQETLDLNKLCPGKISVRFLEPIPTAGLSREDAPALAQKAREAIEKALFEMDESHGRAS